MIYLDGVQLNKVVSIECNDDTGFRTRIMFQVDSRLEGCTDITDFEKSYSLERVQAETEDTIGIYRITLPRFIDITFET